MKIAVFHNQPTGGARRALHGFLAELRSHHVVDVFTFSTADDRWLHDADVARRVQRYELTRRRPIRFGLYLNDVLRSRDLRDLAGLYREVASDIDSNAYDVVLVDVCQFSLVPPVMISLRTPSLYYAHNGPARLEGGTWDPRLSTWGRLRSCWHRPFERALARQVEQVQSRSINSATRVAANSRHTASRLHDAFGVASAVCPPGVDIPPATPKVEGDYVLSVGEIEPRKGFAFIVDALAALPPQDRPTLRIVANRANPVERAVLERRALAGGVELDVLVDPPADVLSASYAAARIFLYAAHHEALGLAPLEAMAHATPVVAVAEGGSIETVAPGVTGELVPRDINAFASAVDALLADDRRRARFGAAAREYVIRQWAWPERASALESLLTAAAGHAEVTRS